MSEIACIKVRDAVPADAAAVSRLLIMAWPVEDFLAMFPGMSREDFADFVSQFISSENNLYSYKNTMVAVHPTEEGERIVGMMNGYDGAEYESLKLPVADRFDEVYSGCPTEFRQTRETGPGEFYLDSAGVDPQMRSMGIGSKLFAAMFARAAAGGFDTVGLIVDEDKPKAEALYLRLGFEVKEEVDFLGHKMKHMQKKLTAEDIKNK